MLCISCWYTFFLYRNTYRVIVFVRHFQPKQFDLFEIIYHFLSVCRLLFSHFIVSCTRLRCPLVKYCLCLAPPGIRFLKNNLFFQQTSHVDTRMVCYFEIYRHEFVCAINHHPFYTDVQLLNPSISVATPSVHVKLGKIGFIYFSDVQFFFLFCYCCFNLSIRFGKSKKNPFPN